MKQLERTLNTTRSRVTGEIPHKLQGVVMQNPPKLMELCAADEEEIGEKVKRAKRRLQKAAVERKRYQRKRSHSGNRYSKESTSYRTER